MSPNRPLVPENEQGLHKCSAKATVSSTVTNTKPAATIKGDATPQAAAASLSIKSDAEP